MNKTLSMRIGSVLLVLALLIMSSMAIFAEGEEQGGEGEATVDPDEVLRNYAIKKGVEYGEMFAGRDYMKGLSSDPNRHFANREEVFKYFKLSSDSSHHKDIFYNEFIDSYGATYESKYIEISMQDKDNNETFWFSVAKKFATIEGEMAAYYDHLNELSEDWERAYKKMTANEDLTERFRLYRYSGSLPENFELDFKLEFKISYKRAYAEAIVTDNELNTNYYYIDTHGGELEYERTYKEMTKSSIKTLNMPKVAVTFPERTLLLRTPMAIRYKQNKGMTNVQSLVQLSDIYQLEVQRGKKSARFHESPTFTINGYAVRGAGIYKWKYNRWNYLYTVAEDKTLSTVLDPGIYKNTNFCVLLDQAYTVPSDIAFNWAYKEIYIAIRRHHLPMTEKYYPDKKITRLQLAQQIYKTMSYRGNVPTKGEIPEDVKALKDYYPAINYCLKNGYIKVDKEGKFNPSGLVTYEEFESIMKNLYSADFSIKAYTNDILSKEYHRSDYITKKNNNISKAEVTYAFSKYLD